MAKKARVIKRATIQKKMESAEGERAVRGCEVLSTGAAGRKARYKGRKKRNLVVVLTTRVPIAPSNFNLLGVLSSWLRARSPLEGRRKDTEGEE